MSDRMILNVRMELLSDCLFYTGVGMSGGGQMAVVRDADGYPYLKSTTFRGILRESIRNVLAWTADEKGSGEAAQKTLETLFGTRGITAPQPRELQFTSLRLVQLPEDAASCFSSRTFITMEDGREKIGSLRSCAVIRKGLVLEGTLRCAREDEALVRSGLSAIKWVGSMSQAGLGYVRVHSRELPEEQGRKAARISADCRCLRYVLHTETPVRIRDLRESSKLYQETGNRIPGAAVRGMVMEALSEKDPAWFAENRQALLGGVRFLDAVPNPAALTAIPSLMGFYEDKTAAVLESVVADGAFHAGYKRAGLGSFCAFCGETIEYWDAESSEMVRKSEKTTEEQAAGGKNVREKRIFFTRFLAEGQDFEGYILLDEKAPAAEIAAVLDGALWIGAERHSGFGLCSVKALEAMDVPLWETAYGYSAQDTPGEHLYLALLSSATMLNEWGEPCGIHEGVLAEKLGVNTVEILYCSTGLEEVGGYNRTRNCALPQMRMYRAGSLFHLKCDTAPAAERLRAIQREGLGIRREEGCGAVLFLRPELYEALAAKRELSPELSEKKRQAAVLRRAKYRWVMKNAQKMRAFRLTGTDIHLLQASGERSLAQNDGGAAFMDHLTVQAGRNKRTGSYRDVKEFFQQLLRTPLEELLEIPCQDDWRVKQELLLLLLKTGRKEGMK